MPTPSSSAWRRVALVPVAAVLALTACSDDGDSAGTDGRVDIEDVAGDPQVEGPIDFGDEGLVGNLVTVSGEVERVLLAGEAFVLSDVEGGVLVVMTEDTAVLGVDPTPGQAVEVRGEVVRFDLDVPSEPDQEVLREELYGAFVGEHALVAEHVAYAAQEEPGDEDN